MGSLDKKKVQIRVCVYASKSMLALQCSNAHAEPWFHILLFAHLLKTNFVIFNKGGSNNSDKLICALSCVYFC